MNHPEPSPILSFMNSRVFPLNVCIDNPIPEWRSLLHIWYLNGDAKRWFWFICSFVPAIVRLEARAKEILKISSLYVIFQRPGCLRSARSRISTMWSVSLLFPPGWEDVRSLRRSSLTITSNSIRSTYPHIYHRSQILTERTQLTCKYPWIIPWKEKETSLLLPGTYARQWIPTWPASLRRPSPDSPFFTGSCVSL